MKTMNPVDESDENEFINDEYEEYTDLSPYNLLHIENIIRAGCLALGKIVHKL